MIVLLLQTFKGDVYVKKVFNRISVFFIITAMLAGFFTLGVSAEDEPEKEAVFSLEIISETADSISVGLLLEEGSFSSLEIKTVTTDLKCTEIKKGEMLERFYEKEWAEAYSSVNPESGTAAFICTALYSYPGEFLVLSFDKEAFNYSLEVIVPSCAVIQNGNVVEIPAVVNNKIINEMQYCKLPDMTIRYKESAYLNIPSADESAGETYIYESSDPKTVRIDSSGKITGAKKGSATVSAIYSDQNGTSIFYTCKVTVKYSISQWIIMILLLGWVWY